MQGGGEHGGEGGQDPGEKNPFDAAIETTRWGRFLNEAEKKNKIMVLKSRRK